MTTHNNLLEEADLSALDDECLFVVGAGPGAGPPSNMLTPLTGSIVYFTHTTMGRR